MTDRSTRDTQYVLVQDPKSKKTTRYYYDADDDNDSQIGTSTRRIVRAKPTKEQRIRYVSSDEVESNYRRPRVAESSDRRMKIRNTTTGDQVVLDEDNNIIKIIRRTRSPTTPPPPIVENRQHKIRPREARTVYYETSNGHLVAQPRRNQASTRSKNDFVYAEEEPTKVVRKIIIDPRTGDQETSYENDKPKKQVQPKYVVRKHTSEIPDDSDNEDEQQPQYVQVVEHRTVPKQEAPPTKYMMVRKKVDSEPVYAVQSSIPAGKNTRRVVYEAPTKKSPATYIYSSSGKYYK